MNLDSHRFQNGPCVHMTGPILSAQLDFEMYTRTTKVFVTPLMCPRREASQGHFGKKAGEMTSEILLSQGSVKPHLLFYGETSCHQASLFIHVFLAKQLRISRAKTYQGTTQPSDARNPFPQGVVSWISLKSC